MITVALTSKFVAIYFRVPLRLSVQPAYAIVDSVMVLDRLRVNRFRLRNDGGNVS